jgi:hypothetical protein
VPTETISTGAQTPSSSDSKQWKIIGIAVIVVSIVVAVIFVVVFFDQWWSFLCDMVVGKRTGDWKENLVPDWEKRSWEFKRVSDQYPPAPPFPSELATKHQSIEDDRHPFPERPPNSNPFSPETVELGLAGCGTHRAKHDSGGHANEPAPGIHTAT